MNNNSKIVHIEKFNIAKVNHRIQELNEKLRTLDPGLPDAELVRRALPIWQEIETLRDRQTELFEQNMIVIRSGHKDFKRIRADLDEQMQTLEGRIMEIETIPILESAAVTFIQSRGLEAEFSAYLESEISTLNIQ